MQATQTCGPVRPGALLDGPQVSFTLLQVNDLKNIFIKVENLQSDTLISVSDICISLDFCCILAT